MSAPPSTAPATAATAAQQQQQQQQPVDAAKEGSKVVDHSAESDADCDMEPQPSQAQLSAAAAMAAAARNDEMAAANLKSDKSILDEVFRADGAAKPGTANNKPLTRSASAASPRSMMGGGGAGLATYTPQQPMAFQGVGFDRSQSGVFGSNASGGGALRKSRSMRASIGGGPATAAAAAATGAASSSGDVLKGSASLANIAHNQTMIAVAAALERQRMPLLQVIGDALRLEEFGNMENEARSLRRDFNPKDVKSKVYDRLEALQSISSTFAANNSASTTSPFRRWTSGGMGSRGNTADSTAAVVEDSAGVTFNPRENRKSVQSREGTADSTAKKQLQQQQQQQQPLTTSAGSSGGTSAKKSVLSSSDDDQEQSAAAASLVRAEYAANGLYRRRLTAQEQQELEAVHGRTTADVRERARRVLEMRMQDAEGQMEASARKAAFAARWRSFEEKKKTAQVQLLWSTLILAVSIMLRWDRERRVRVASGLMARSVVPMLRWRRRRKEREAQKKAIIDCFEVPPLTADLLMLDNLLKFFGRAHLATIVQYARKEAFLKDYNLVYFREPGRDCFIIVHGEVDVWVESPTGNTDKNAPKYSLECVKQFKAPAVVGSVGMVTKEKRNARLTCRTDVIAYVIDHNDFIKERPSREVMMSAMAEAHRQHLLNMRTLYRTYTSANALGCFYTMERIDVAIIEELRKYLRPTIRKPGEYLIRAGERSSSMFLLMEGKVDFCPPDDDFDTPHEANVEKALAMLDVMGHAKLRENRRDGVPVLSRKQRLAQMNIVRPKGYIPTCDTPDKYEDKASPLNPHMTGQLNANELERRSHTMQVTVSIKAKSLQKYMIGGPRFFLLDAYDMNVIVRNSVDLFEITRDEFMKVMMRDPQAVVDTRKLCLGHLCDYLEPPKDQDIAATVFGEFPAVKYSRRVLQANEFGRVLAERPIVRPAGKPLIFDNTCKKHHDVWFVLRGEISRVQRRKLNIGGGAEDDDQQQQQQQQQPGGGGPSSSGNSPARRSSPSARGGASSPSGRRSGGVGVGFRRPNTQQAKDGTFSFQAGSVEVEQQYLMWPSLSQVFYSNQSYAQSVTKRLEGFRVSRGNLLRWITQCLGNDDERWALFRDAIVKPFGSVERVPTFHALTTDEHTREIFIRRGIINPGKIRYKTDDPIGYGGMTRAEMSVSEFHDGGFSAGGGGGGSPVGLADGAAAAAGSGTLSSIKSGALESNASNRTTMIKGVSGLSTVSKASLGTLRTASSTSSGGSTLKGAQPPGGGNPGRRSNLTSSPDSAVDGPSSSASGGTRQPRPPAQPQHHDDVVATANMMAAHVRDSAAAGEVPPQLGPDGRPLRRKVSIRMSDGKVVSAGAREGSADASYPRHAGAGLQRRASAVGFPDEEHSDNTSSRTPSQQAGPIPGLRRGGGSGASPSSPVDDDFGPLAGSYGSGRILPPLTGLGSNGAAAAAFGGRAAAQRRRPSGELYSEHEQAVVLSRFRRPMADAIAEVRSRHMHEHDKKRAATLSPGRRGRKLTSRGGGGSGGDDDHAHGDAAPSAPLAEAALLDPMALEARRLQNGGVSHVPMSTLIAAQQRAASAARRHKLPAAVSAAAPGADAPATASHAGGFTARLNIGGGGLVTDLVGTRRASLVHSVSDPPLAALWGASTDPQPRPALSARVGGGAGGLVAGGAGSSVASRQALAGTVRSYQVSQQHVANPDFEAARKPLLERMKKTQR